MLANALEAALVVGQWQQVVEMVLAVAGPGQVFRERLWLVALHQRGDAIQMPFVEWLVATNGQADAMDGQGHAFPHRPQPGMRRTAGAKEVLGMHLDERRRPGIGEQRFMVRGLRTDARRGRQRRFLAVRGRHHVRSTALNFPSRWSPSLR